MKKNAGRFFYFFFFFSFFFCFFLSFFFLFCFFFCFFVEKSQFSGGFCIMLSLMAITFSILKLMESGQYFFFLFVGQKSKLFILHFEKKTCLKKNISLSLFLFLLFLFFF